MLLLVGSGRQLAMEREHLRDQLSEKVQVWPLLASLPHPQSPSIHGTGTEAIK